MDIFIARQPIFNRKQDVIGYELLFRSGLDNYFNFHDIDQASSRVIADSSILFGIETLTGGKKAFINVSRAALLNEYAQLLPREFAVLELLETVEPDPEVIEAWKKLKQKGFMLALDDFCYHESSLPLLELSDIVKVDFLLTMGEERRVLAERLLRMGKTMLAEKVETTEEYQEAVALGFHYFQGYFFSKPTVLSKRNMASNKMATLHVLKQIHSPHMDFNQLDATIRKDLNLSFKLLKYINSAFFNLRGDISSIKHALVLMGEAEIKKWATLLSLSTMGDDKPLELMNIATIRGRMCEMVAKKAHLEDKNQEFFLMGLFSVIDALLDRNIGEILAEIPLPREIKVALMRTAPNVQRQVLETVLAYEQGKWHALEKWAGKLGVNENDVSQIYMDAVQWARPMVVGR